jgi:hypothetical protein
VPGALRDSEWWSTVELTPDRTGTVLFVDRATADEFAAFLMAEGAGTVLVAHWRGGRCIGLEAASPLG